MNIAYSGPMAALVRIAGLIASGHDRAVGTPPARKIALNQFPRAAIPKSAFCHSSAAFSPNLV
jgi:hypothetical protein